MKRIKNFETKLFLQYLILVTIPLMLMGILSYNIYVKGEKLRNEIELQSYSDIIKSDYENIFDGIKKFYMDFSNSENYIWLQNQKSPPYYNYVNLTKVIQNINGGYAFNNYIKNYNFINIENNWTITKDGIFLYDDIKNKKQVDMFIKAQKSQLGSVYWVNNSNYSSPINNSIPQSKSIDLSGEFLVLKRQNFNKEITSLLMVQLDTGKLSTIASKYSEMGYETIILNNEKMFLSTSPSFTNAYFNNLYVSNDTILSENGTRYKISKIDSYSNGMTYIVGYDTNKNSEGGKVFVYIALIIMVLYGILLIILKKLARYESKPFKFLQDRAANNLVHVKKQFAQNIVLGLIDENKINKMLIDLNISECSTYKVFVLSLKNDDTNTLYNNDTINDIVDNMTEEIVKECYLNPIRISDNIVFLIGSSNYYLLEQKVAILYAEVKTYLDKYDTLQFNTGISDSLAKLILVKQGYEQCLKAISIENRDSDKESLSINIYNEKSLISDQNAYDIIIENELIGAIKRCGSEDEIKKILKIIVTRIDKRCAFDFEKDYCYSKLNISITNVAIEHNISLSYIYNTSEEDVFLKTHNIYNSKDLINFYYAEIISPIIKNILLVNEDKKDDVAINILKLISDSKGRLTLNECAEKLNYSTTYLSKVLIQYKGESFTDLCNNEKIKYAKYLLLTTDYSINDIATELGYNNVQNFIRFFKKQTEVTPLSFRKDNSSDKI